MTPLSPLHFIFCYTPPHHHHTHCYVPHPGITCYILPCTLHPATLRTTCAPLGPPTNGCTLTVRGHQRRSPEPRRGRPAVPQGRRMNTAYMAGGTVGVQLRHAVWHNMHAAGAAEAWGVASYATMHAAGAAEACSVVQHACSRCS